MLGTISMFSSAVKIKKIGNPKLIIKLNLLVLKFSQGKHPMIALTIIHDEKSTIGTSKISNLYFTGASTSSGTGLPMVTISGKITADRIENDLH